MRLPLGLSSKMRFIAISMVSSSGIGTFLERFVFLIWETKEKVSLQE